MYETNADGHIVESDTFSLNVSPNIRQRAVYVLLCRTAAGYDIEQKRAQDMLGRSPDWLGRAVGSKERIYVGYSKQPLNRINTHTSGAGADFTSLFKPVRLLDIWDSMNETEARSYEEETASRIQRAHPDFFVYQY